MTGFEATTPPHLGNVFRPNFLTCAYSKGRSEFADFDGPRLSASDHYCHWRVVFRWCGFLGILHHGHHMSFRTLGRFPANILYYV